MANSLQFFDPGPSFSEKLGSALGTGLGGGLQQLALQKLQQLQQQQQLASALAPLGISPDQSIQIAQLPKPVQTELLKRYVQSQVPKRSRSGIESLQQMEQQQEPTGLDQLRTEEPSFATQQAQPKESPIIKKAKKIVPEEKIKESITLKEPVKKERERLPEQEKLKKISVAEQKRIDADTKKVFDDVTGYKKLAEIGDLNLPRMKKLVERGKLPYSAFYQLFKNLEEHVTPSTGAAAGAAIGGILGGLGGPAVSATGAGLGAGLGGAVGGLVSPVATLLRYGQRYTSPDSEEFEKLSQDFLKGAKSIFGSRITDRDLQEFLKMIPTLANTDKGKLAIIRNMELFNKGSKLRYDAMKDIIRENNNKRPADLQFLIDERIKPQLDKIAEEFINEDEEVPKLARK